MIKIVLTFLLSACVLEQPIQPAPAEFLRAETCINTDRVEVFQYGDEITLLKVYMCQNDLKYPAEECKKLTKYNGYIYDYDKHLVAVNTKQFIGKEKALKDHMFDESVIGLGGGCIVPDGTYSYTTAMGIQKTVQKVRYLSPKEAKKPNPEYEKWKVEQEAKAKQQEAK